MLNKERGMSTQELLWSLLKVIFSGYVVCMIVVTVFFTAWLIKEWFWPTEDWAEELGKEIKEESLASWEEKESQKTIF